jgi:hypothetical protein
VLIKLTFVIDFGIGRHSIKERANAPSQVPETKKCGETR